MNRLIEILELLRSMPLGKVALWVTVGNLAVFFAAKDGETANGVEGKGDPGAKRRQHRVRAKHLKSECRRNGDGH